MEKVDVLLGLQWGDEGKGKIVDVLTPHYDIVARFQGGPNAGHTLEFNGEKYVLRSIPSGIFQGEKTNVIGNGVVLDPLLFKEEAEALARSGSAPGSRRRPGTAPGRRGSTRPAAPRARRRPGTRRWPPGRGRRRRR